MWQLALGISCSACAGEAKPFAAAIGKALATEKADARLTALGRVAGELPLADIASALARADALAELRERAVFRQTVLSRWSTLAPEAAFRHIAGLPESVVKTEAIKTAAVHFAGQNPAAAAVAVAQMPAGPARGEAGPLVAEIWARKSVPPALEWAQQLPEDFPREPILHAIRFVWVHVEPRSAIPHVLALRADQMRNALLMNIAGAWAATDDPAAAWQWAHGLPSEADKHMIFLNVIESWADRAPRDAIEFSLRQAEVPERRERLALAALALWAAQHPPDALAWVLAFATSALRDAAFATVLETWASAEPLEAAHWIKKLPANAARDAAIHAYLAAVGEWNPAETAELATLLSEAARQAKDR